MEKKEFQFPIGNVEGVALGKEIVSVEPFLSQEDMNTLISEYLEHLNTSNTFDYLRAEMLLMMGVINACTNMKIVEESEGSDTLLFNYDDVYRNYDVYLNIISKIKNYSLFRETLDKAVAEVLEQRRLEKSLGKVIENIYEKTTNLLNQLMSLDLDDATINKFKEMLSSVESSPILKELAKINKPEKTSEKASKPRTRKKA